MWENTYEWNISGHISLTFGLTSVEVAHVDEVERRPDQLVLAARHVRPTSALVDVPVPGDVEAVRQNIL